MQGDTMPAGVEVKSVEFMFTEEFQMGFGLQSYTVESRDGRNLSLRVRLYNL